ncbi:hypothetical protein HK101_001392 [Irineochytrium annulatum]|nr:hypothetical protein HK101_001392 [Irineochytrium annulatum]
MLIIIAGWAVVGIDALTNTLGDREIKQTRLAALKHASMSFQCLDIADGTRVASLFDSYTPDAVYHFAAQPNVRWCDAHPGQSRDVNVVAAGKFLAALAAHRQRRGAGSATIKLIVASSGSVYGDQPVPWDEDAPTAPRGHYATQKVQLERLAEGVAGPAHGVDVVVLRFFSVYGPLGRMDMAVSSFANAIWRGERVLVNGNALRKRRDMTYIGDAVKCCIAALGITPKKGFAVINVGTGIATLLGEVVGLMERMLGRRAIVSRREVFDGVRADLNVTKAGVERMREELGVVAEVGLEDGLRKTISAMRERRRIAVVAVIATRGPNTLLVARCLQSIAAQTRMPDWVVVAVDTLDSKLIDQTRLLAESKLESLDRYLFVPNWRTQGASGAWNSGILKAFEIFACGKGLHPGDVFIAILDDDDSWEPDHVRVCLDIAKRQDADVVVSGIIRHESARTRSQSIPTTLEASQFLHSNPHIQGSNMFIKLSTFLQAGLFDESLRSTTDRDMMIRVLDLREVRAAFTGVHTVRHYADGVGHEAVRMSAPRSEGKLAGLTAFWRKYGERMSVGRRDAFERRAKDLFGWEKPAAIEVDSGEGADEETFGLDEEGPMEPVDLHVGFTTDSSLPMNARALMTDLAALSASEGSILKSMTVHVVENGPRYLDQQGRGFRQRVLGLINPVSANKYRLNVITNDDQIERCDDRASGVAIPSWVRATCVPNVRTSIAESRTLLQHAIYNSVSKSERPAIWILDDDKRLVDATGRSIGGRTLRRALLTRRKHNADIILGVDEGSPPLPEAMTIRGQLVDVYHFLAACHARWSGITGDGDVSECHATWDVSDVEVARASSYFHDAAGDHVETPARRWRGRGVSLSTTFERLPGVLAQIEAGASPCRPHVPGLSVERSVQRGGNTFFFDANALLVPNSSPVLKGRFARRSDFNMALVNQQMGRIVVRDEGVRVFHERVKATKGELTGRVMTYEIREERMRKAIDDALGHAAFWALEFLLRRGRDVKDDIDAATEVFVERASRRLICLAAGMARVTGIIGACEGMLIAMEVDTRGHPVWRQGIQRIRAPLSRLREVFEASEWTDIVTREFRELPVHRGAVRAWLASFGVVDGLTRQHKARL